MIVWPQNRHVTKILNFAWLNTFIAQDINGMRDSGRHLMESNIMSPYKLMYLSRIKIFQT